MQGDTDRSLINFAIAKFTVHREANFSFGVFMQYFLFMGRVNELIFDIL
jgi:hypothetical protein